MLSVGRHDVPQSQVIDFATDVDFRLEWTPFVFDNMFFASVVRQSTGKCKFILPAAMGHRASQRLSCQEESLSRGVMSLCKAGGKPRWMQIDHNNVLHTRKPDRSASTVLVRNSYFCRCCDFPTASCPAVEHEIPGQCSPPPSIVEPRSHTIESPVIGDLMWGYPVAPRHRHARAGGLGG